MVLNYDGLYTNTFPLFMNQGAEGSKVVNLFSRNYGQ
jgi:hypothetical protein